MENNENTSYKTYTYKGREYLRFEYVKKYFFGFFKRKTYKFIPTKHFFDEKNRVISKWKLSQFPEIINDYTSKSTIYGDEKERKLFIHRYPVITMYLIELNKFLKNY